MSDGDEKMSDRVPIRKLPSGVPGLDEVLGGGFPEFSFNLIAGGPGSGKTTMAHQIMFANASPERKAVYFSIVGEPPIKMLRYQQLKWTPSFGPRRGAAKVEPAFCSSVSYI